MSEELCPCGWPRAIHQLGFICEYGTRAPGAVIGAAMPERVRHIVLPLPASDDEYFVPIETGYIHDDSTPPVILAEYEIRDKWKPEPPTETWSDWRQVDSVDDEHPTYYAEHNPDGGLFRAPTLRAMHPHIRRTVTWERKLIRRWVDEDQGLMMQVVDVERRSDRA